MTAARRNWTGRGGRQALAVLPMEPVAPPTIPCNDTGIGVHGAGWHASTWDLQQGLDVREGLPGDAMDEEVLMAYLCTQGIVE